MTVPPPPPGYAAPPPAAGEGQGGAGPPPPPTGPGGRPAPAPVPVELVDQAHWEEVVDRLALAPGGGTVTAGAVASLVGRVLAVVAQPPGLFDPSQLEGLVSPQVLSQQARTAAARAGTRVDSASVAAVGTATVDAAPRLRILVRVSGRDGGGRPLVEEQAWDLAVNAAVRITAQQCGACGAPMHPGDARCRYCGASAAVQTSTGQAPLVVTRLVAD